MVLPAEALPTMLNAAAYNFGRGDLLREWNDLNGAEILLAQGQELIRGMLLVEADSIVAGYVALAKLHQARGASESALATLTELEEVAHQRTFAAHLRVRGAAMRAQFALSQGMLTTAMEWAEHCGLHVDDPLSYSCELEYLTLARVHIAQGRHDPTSPAPPNALHLLDCLLAAAESDERTDSAIEILILRSLAFQARHDLLSAFQSLARALQFAAPEGYVRIFVDEGRPMAALLAQALDDPSCLRIEATQSDAVRAYAQSLLAVFQAEGIDPQTSRVTPSTAFRFATAEADVLTERELEVLRLLALGHSNQAIAQELVVAVGTVKRHVSNIIDKLMVESRLQAVARARELDLV